VGEEMGRGGFRIGGNGMLYYRNHLPPQIPKVDSLSAAFAKNTAGNL